jgi:hypothetical protein
MARGRMLSTSVSLSKRLADLPSDTVRLIITWAFAHQDRDGRVAGDPAILRAQVVPMLEHISIADVNDALDAAADVGLLVRYRDVNGYAVVAFPRFEKHQSGFRYDKEGRSKFGAAPDSANIGAVTPDQVRRKPDQLRLKPAEVEEEVEEKKKRKGERKRSSPAQQSLGSKTARSALKRSGEAKLTKGWLLKLAWGFWRELYLLAYDRAYASSGACAKAIGVAANAALEEARDHHPDGPTADDAELARRVEQLLRHRFCSYLKDDGNKGFLVRHKHQLRYLDVSVGDYLLPWGPGAAATPELRRGPPPPTVGTSEVRLSGGGRNGAEAALARATGSHAAARGSPATDDEPTPRSSTEPKEAHG